MVRIPYIKIPSVRVESIVPTSNIGTGGATPAPPTPITYLTQWQMMGNSVVHTDEYLTQWKVEGNSVVDNNAILSCGDLGLDGYYHVKISNGVTIYDIALTEPLRKVNDIADTIEFANGVAVVTRNIGSGIMSDFTWIFSKNNFSNDKYVANSNIIQNIKKAKSNNDIIRTFVCPIYSNISANIAYAASATGVALVTNGTLRIFDQNYENADDFDAFLTHIQGVELIYELDTPTTETIQVSPFPISPTDTYTSANDTSYSAFEYKKNVEIWSCGEYSEVDDKYHILVQPLGGSIADIILDEPLRKYNNAVDSIEYDDSVATLTREVEEIDGQLNILDTPTTETIEVSQIEEAESYTCVISQGAKAVEWSSFITNSE